LLKEKRRRAPSPDAASDAGSRGERPAGARGSSEERRCAGQAASLRL